MNLQDIFKNNLCEKDFKELSPIVLAFIGDSVHTLFVRNSIVKNTTQNVNSCHKQSANKCNAKAQAIKLDEVFNILTPNEQDIVRRARNAKTHHIAKNFDVETYKKATSFEALIGYLYLLGNYQRLNQILNYTKQGE